jgi:outer membrane protein assembly factor BamD (BamD/ComL family)
MRFTVPFFALLLVLFSACGGGETASTEEANSVTEEATSTAYLAAESALKDGKGAGEVSKLLMDNFNAVSDPNTGALNLAESREFTRLARKLAEKYPGDTTVALPFYRSAEVVRAMNDPKRAAAIYKDVASRFPNFSKAAEAMFMLAFTYDEDLKDYDSAKATYTEFLEKYPTHSFADDTEMLLKNLGKSDEEILRELEEKVKEQ